MIWLLFYMRYKLYGEHSSYAIGYLARTTLTVKDTHQTDILSKQSGKFCNYRMPLGKFVGRLWWSILICPSSWICWITHIHAQPQSVRCPTFSFFYFFPFTVNYLNCHKLSKEQWPACYGVLLFTLATNFFSFTLLFWNQMVICRSDRLVTAEIFLLLSFVMNLLAAYSFSSSLSWTLV